MSEYTKKCFADFERVPVVELTGCLFVVYSMPY